MSIFIAGLVAAQAFVFHSDVDRFTDEEVAYVTVGDIDRGPGILIECGRSSMSPFIVTIIPGQAVARSSFTNSMAMFRFDDAEAFNLPASYDYREVKIEFDYAERLIDGMQNSETMLVAVNGSNGRIDMEIQLQTAAEAVGQLVQRCRTAR